MGLGRFTLGCAPAYGSKVLAFGQAFYSVG
jgi:hypothetical protein